MSLIIFTWKIFQFYHKLKIHILYLTGDLINEEEVLNWLIEQKSTATIEEVTDEILKNLVDEHEYVLVYFSKSSIFSQLIDGKTTD